MCGRRGIFIHFPMVFACKSIKQRQSELELSSPIPIPCHYMLHTRKSQLTAIGIPNRSQSPFSKHLACVAGNQLKIVYKIVQWSYIFLFSKYALLHSWYFKTRHFFLPFLSWRLFYSFIISYNLFPSYFQLLLFIVVPFFHHQARSFIYSFTHLCLFNVIDTFNPFL